MTLEITKSNGELSPESRAAFTAFFRSLQDGGHIIAAYPAGGAAGQIERIAAWYNGVSEVEQSDPAYLDRLISKSNELAYYLLRFSGELGELYADKNATVLRRKAAHNASLWRLRNEAKGRNEKFVSAVAEIEAQTETADLLASESLADALYQSAKLLYDAAGNIQQRMSQKISNLKAHREAYLRADNCNFPG